MENLFEIINVSEGGKKGLRLGVRVKIGGQESVCPVSGVYKSPGELADDLKRLTAGLDGLTFRARVIFSGEREPVDQVLSSDMPPDEAWKVLSATADEGYFIALFNRLDEEKRKEIAEYVLTRCNIFAGRGAGFSSRYNTETALLEDG